MKATARALLLGLVAVAIQAAMVFAFTWPAARLAPRDIPLVVAGPAPAVSAVVRQLDQRQPDAFAIKQLPDPAAARTALRGREAYGAIVITPAGPRMLVASAASPVVAADLTQLGNQLAGRPGAPVPDVVTTDSHDSHGAVFSSLLLPLIMSSLAGGILLGLMIGSIVRRAVGLVTFSILGGVVTAAIVQTFLSALPGPFLAIAGVIGLVVLAVAGTVVGLTAVVGRPGYAVAGLLMMLVANPLSGATSAPELLPQPWGAIGQAMPAGAGGTLLRSVAYYHGARSGAPLTALVIWSAAGLLLLGLGALRARRTVPSVTRVPEPQRV